MGMEMFQYVDKETERVKSSARHKSHRGNRNFDKLNREVTADAVKADLDLNDGSIIFGPGDEVFDDPQPIDKIMKPIRDPAPEQIERPMSNIEKA